MYCEVISHYGRVLKFYTSEAKIFATPNNFCLSLFIAASFCIIKVRVIPLSPARV